ncbi:MAG: hypothetical protein WC636_03275, partial [Candidatus Margulisiibacteriota bacterium]
LALVGTLVGVSSILGGVGYFSIGIYRGLRYLARSCRALLHMPITTMTNPPNLPTRRDPEAVYQKRRNEYERYEWQNSRTALPTRRDPEAVYQERGNEYDAAQRNLADCVPPGTPLTGLNNHPHIREARERVAKAKKKLEE